AFSYSLGFDGKQLELSKPLEYPTASFNLYVPNVGLQIDSPQLKPQGPAELGGQQYLLYSAQGLPRGTELRIRFGNLPAAQRTPAPELVGAILGIGCAALVGGLLVVFYRQRAQREAPALALAGNGHAAEERA